MPIKRGSEYRKKGERDAKRHREKQKEVVKKEMKKIISNTPIITRKKDKKVKIPIKGIVIPRFRPGRRTGKGKGKQTGMGQGEGKKGDIIEEKPGEGEEPGKPGNKPGEDYIESEVEIAEIIELMFEDLGLPNLEDKENISMLESVEGYKVSGIKRSGPDVLLDKKQTSKQGIGRFFAFLETLKEETEQDALVCYNALKQADGNLGLALEYLEEGIEVKYQEIEPFPIILNEDRRYMNIREEITHHSNAVIFAMMDVSGSMTQDKKYLARSLLFWINEFLKKIYENVEVRFIIHHARAKLVSEENFFKIGVSGGTKCVEAYKMAKDLIETQYPPSSWNIYAFHFSDGEDWNPEATVSVARKLIEDININMLGYGEIRLDGRPFSSSLREEFKNRLKVKTYVREELKLIIGKKEHPFLGMIIKDKDHILPAIKELLKKERWN